MALTETLHIDTVSAGRRHVEAVMPITSDVLQPHGYLHGGATIALLETVASIGAEQSTDFERERPFGVDVRVRHRKGGKKGLLRGVADLDREEVSERTGAVKQYWNVAAYDEAGDVVSDGVIMTKIVPLALLSRKAKPGREPSSPSPCLARGGCFVVQGASAGLSNGGNRPRPLVKKTWRGKYCHIFFYLRLHCAIISVAATSSLRVVAQLGRALRSGRRGRRFKSCQPDQGAKGM